MEAGARQAVPTANKLPRDKLPADAQRMRAWALGQVKHYAAYVNPFEAQELALMIADQKKEFPLGGMPLIVLTAGRSEYGPDEQALAGLSRNGKQVVAVGSGHHIHIEDPELVIKSIRDILAAIPSNRIVVVPALRFYWMAFIGISGEPGCRYEELARIVARRLSCELVADSRLVEMIAAEFGAPNGIPDKAWPHLATSILAKLGSQQHLLIASVGCELLFPNLHGVLRVHVLAPESRRVGNVMVDQRLDRPNAKELLKRMESEQSVTRKRRFGRAGSRLQNFDLVLNAETLAVDDMADVVEAAVKSKGLLEAGVLSLAAEAQVQFQVRLKLARYGIVPPDRVHLERKEFGHPSEEVFANLLDFYRIAWEYEPRSFPLQWDKDGKVLEAFTPDFYLPEFDMYVELTTMKQANVTRKNRKIRLLRTIYPHVNIQVFYQKDVQDLVMKYGLPERLAR